MVGVPELVRCPPVLMCGFARPDLLIQVFEQVRKAKPSKLYLWLNKARSDRPDEIARNAKCREIFDSVDWSCQVSRAYSERYLDVTDSLEGAFDWVFRNEDRAIVLEDDCVPDLSFFQYCGELLEKYKDDTRVGAICGSDEHLHVKNLETHGDSYYFDRFFISWGWASWRRVWTLYAADLNMNYWPEFRKRTYLMDGLYRSARALKKFNPPIDALYRKESGSWDGKISVLFYKENMVSIHPFVNLISNVGCGRSSWQVGRNSVLKGAGHVRGNRWADHSLERIEMPLHHPVTMQPNIVSERWRILDDGTLSPLYKELYLALKRLTKKLLKR